MTALTVLLAWHDQPLPGPMTYRSLAAASVLLAVLVTVTLAAATRPPAPTPPTLVHCPECAALLWAGPGVCPSCGHVDGEDADDAEVPGGAS